MAKLPLRGRILETMRLGNFRPMSKLDLSQILQIPERDLPKLRKVLDELEKEGVISACKKGRFQARAAATNQLRGNLKFTPKGDAWFFADVIDAENIASGLDLEKHGRLHIARHDTGTALDGDRVLIHLLAPRPSARDFRRGRTRGGETEEPEIRGKVERVLERRSGRIVGIFKSKGKNAWIEADDLAVSGNIDVTGDTTAQPGQLVVVHIDNWDRTNPSGRVIEVLGWPGEAGVDIMAIIHRNGIRTSFPEEVLAEARAVPEQVDPEEMKRREDWRDRLVVTIDPADAKDHDDAIWVAKTENGWQVAVHIADVSHYVKPRTPLDKEAIERGNSTYLVDRVLPMLPVELSNGICSLKPHVDRLTKCAVLDVNRQGKVIKSRFCDAVINSQAKLSYEQAQDILDGKPAPEGSPAELEPMIKEAWAMASQLRKHRFKVGALDLEMPEIRVKLDDKGCADRIEHVIHTESHQLIEECMLAANEAVAKILKARNKPTIYRIHEDPDFGRLQEYGEVAKAFGYNFGDLTNKDHIQQLLDAARGRPDEHAIKIGLLKSLKRAAYSPDPLGHYGLSKGDYCHFTSPIRRYADLIVHRSLQPYLSNPPKVPDKTPRQSELTEIARHISDTERASSDSENESKTIKLLEYLDRTSKAEEPVVFEGLITEVRPMGLMVEATEIGSRGVVKREDMPPGPWRFEQSQSRVVGPGGRFFQMGQRVKLQVARIDRERRFVDFRIAGEPISPPPPPGSRSGRRSSGQEKSRRQEKTSGAPKAPAAKKKTATRRPSGKSASSEPKQGRQPQSDSTKTSSPRRRRR